MSPPATHSSSRPLPGPCCEANRAAPSGQDRTAGGRVGAGSSIQEEVREELHLRIDGVGVEVLDAGLGEHLVVDEEVAAAGPAVPERAHKPLRTDEGELAFDMMDPEQMAAVESGQMGMPGEVESLTINDIEVTAAGASLTGKGGFDFDMQSMMMSGGMMGSEGSIDLRLAGANGLMDKLVSMGLLPEDQVMGARMMLSMFAVPGDGEDVLNSKIEVKKDGQIMANGQRLK